MTKKRLKKVYKPMAYISIGCFLIYILLSQAMSVFSRTAEIDKLEKEVAIVKKEKNDLQNEVSLLNDDDYVTRYARENYVFTKDGGTSCHLTRYRSRKISKDCLFLF